MTGLRLGFIISLLFIALQTTGCTSKAIDVTESWTVDELYNEARTAMLDGRHLLATEYYEKLQLRYPYGIYAQQSLLDMTYSYYQTDFKIDALESINRFIKLYPVHDEVAYAYYMKGLINFDLNSGFFTRLFDQDVTEREVETVRSSYDDFELLVKLFPDSKYTEDSQARMVFLRNTLAKHEVYVARYYISRGAHLAAVNRCKTVIEQYPFSTAMPDALDVMATAYGKLGMTDLQNDSLRVLAQNFPNFTDERN